MVPALRLAMLAGLGMAIGTAAGQAPAEKGDAPAKQEGPVVKAAGTFTTADELLTALETADANLKTLSADIKYDKTDGIAGDQQVRKGKVFFEEKAGPEGKRDRKFSVRFDELRQGDRVDKDTKLYVFDGEWFIDVSPKFKQMVKRQVVPPGEKFDPLKIGEGPLPLPIGQKKVDIAARFYGELLPEDSGLAGKTPEETEQLKKFVNGSYQLRLVPKPNTEEAGKFAEIRLWYRDLGDGSGLLPRMARTVTPQDNTVSLIQMINVKTNEKIDPKMMAAVEPGADWNVDIQPWAGPAR